MAALSNMLRAELSRFIRMDAPNEWKEFFTLWVAFNAIYGGESEEDERARVMSSVRRFVSKQRAKQVLQGSSESIRRIMETPPGDMRVDQWNPKFRATTQKYKRIYKANSQDPVRQLTALAAVLYQVRCNLTHGSKNPHDQRDRMLVAESVKVLSVLVPAIEDGASSR
jgi:hypothetical protein